MPSPDWRTRTRRVPVCAALTAGLSVATAGGAAASTMPAPRQTGAVKVMGMPAPDTPEAAADDDAMLAWSLRHGSPSERRRMASDLGARFPSDVQILGTTCDKGEGYIGVWVINFGATETHWNVTLDGRGYAGARVLGRSHDYGAIGVPDGRHTVAVVDPASGHVASRLNIDLHCGPGAPRPAATSPVPAPASTTKPATAPRPSPSMTQPQTRTPAPPRGEAYVGPAVETDLVVAPIDAAANTAAAVMLAALLAGTLVLGRRLGRR